MSVSVTSPVVANHWVRFRSPGPARGQGVQTVLDLAAAAAVTIAVLLAPLRLGMLEILRPTLLVMLPGVAFMLVRNLGWVEQAMKSRLGLALIGLSVLLACGHVLGNDVLDGYSESEAILSWENVLVIPLVVLAGVLLGSRENYRVGLRTGLLIGLVLQVGCMAIFPAAVTFREHDRMAGLMHDPNIVVLHIVPVFFLWLALLRKKSEFMLAPVLALGVIWATLQTLSRAGLGSLACGAVVVLIASLAMLQYSRTRISALVVPVLVAGMLGAAYGSRPDFFHERLTAYTARAAERTQQEGTPFEDRLLWLREMEHLRWRDHLANPLGMGYERFQPGNWILPHNTFADVYIISGPVALLLCAGLFFGPPWWLAWGMIRRPRALLTFSHAALLAVVASELLLLFSLSVLTSKVIWLLMGITTGVIASLQSPEPGPRGVPLSEPQGRE